jgi:hypothetical protein
MANYTGPTHSGGPFCTVQVVWTSCEGLHLYTHRTETRDALVQPAGSEVNAPDDGTLFPAFTLRD